MKTSNSQTIKIENMRLVIKTLFELRETSRVELAKITTLNKATISSIINTLMEKDLVVETDKMVKTGGRSAKVVALNRNAGNIISILLLPNHVYGAVTDLYGNIIFDIKKPTPSYEFAPYLKVLLETIDILRNEKNKATYGVIAIGISVYGIVSTSKKIKYATFTSWHDIDLKEIVEKYTGIITDVENEANISALGEYFYHSNHKNSVSLNIGFGVGMGIIIDGKLYIGDNGYAGEIGHNIIVPNGRSCVCGNKGCLETYISEPAILNDYKNLSGKEITIEEFIDAYKNNDPAAIEIYQEFVNNLTIAVNNISQILNPKSIIINSKIVEGITETTSIIKNSLKSKLMNLDILSTSQIGTQINVVGLSHTLILNFLLNTIVEKS